MIRVHRVPTIEEIKTVLQKYERKEPMSKYELMILKWVKPKVNPLEYEAEALTQHARTHHTFMDVLNKHYAVVDGVMVKVGENGHSGNNNQLDAGFSEEEKEFLKLKKQKEARI